MLLLVLPFLLLLSLPLVLLAGVCDWLLFLVFLGVVLIAAASAVDADRRCDLFLVWGVLLLLRSVAVESIVPDQ